MQSTYLNEEFYKSVQNELKQYASSYELIRERSAILEQLEQQRMAREEESYEILEKFGAIL